MNFDLAVLIVIGATLTAILWAVAILLQRVDARVTARGFRNGSIVALILFVITTIVVTIYFNGRASGLITFDLPAALSLGAFAGLVVGLAYLWLGGLLIAIGLIFRSTPAWSTVGAWAAVPVLVVSLGFGYVSFRSVNAEGSGQRPTWVRWAWSWSGAQLGEIRASGTAQCQSTTLGRSGCGLAAE